jgi:hypothetical protein
MRDITSMQRALLRAAAQGTVEVCGFDSAPAFSLSTARSLERRSLVEVGNTDQHRAGGRIYLVSITAHGRAELER